VGWQKEIFHLFNIIPTPKEVFEDLNRCPRSRVPFLFLIVSSVIIGWFMIPAMVEPMRKIFQSTFAAAAAQAAINGVMKSMIIGQLFIAPAVSLLRWLALAGILYLLANMVAGNDGHLFARLYSVIAYSETIFILMNLLTLLLIYVKGIDGIESMHDLTIFKGLETLLDDKNPSRILRSLLSAFNPFTLWYMMTVSIGVHQITTIGRMKSLGMVAIGWLIWMLLSNIQEFAAKLLVPVIG